MLKLYLLANCDACRRAAKWLQAQRVTFDEHPIREEPPTLGELRTMLAAQGGMLKKLFNTAGRDYRDQRIGNKLATLSEADALGLLARNGNLVKRPFLIGTGSDGRPIALVGFDESKWLAALADS